MAQPPRIPVWIESDQAVVYFVTVCEANRREIWDNSEFFEALKLAIEKLEERELWFVYAVVVMPDHLHLLASPMQDRDQEVGDLSGALKRWTNGAASDGKWEWQSGCFDRLLRREENTDEKWEYMRENPVRAGLVERWEEWPWGIGLREWRRMS